jgi:hypothetical protein
MNKTFRLSGIADGKDPDDIHGETVVAEIVIQMRRNGCMSVQGSINDHEFAKYILDTARDTLDTYHARKKLGQDTIIVPAYEKKLLIARDELSDAMGRK